MAEKILDEREANPITDLGHAALAADGGSAYDVLPEPEGMGPVDRADSPYDELDIGTGQEDDDSGEDDSHFEIERAWIADKDRMPWVVAQAKRIDVITQGYVTLENGDRMRVRQIRGQDDTITYESTIKSRIGSSRLVRMEPKTPMTETEFAALWPKTVGMRITKTRYYLEHTTAQGKALTLEVDDYGDRDWLKVEIEFDTAEEATSPDLDFPSWFIEEVTDNKAWGSASLAKDGTPKRYRNRYAKLGGIALQPTAPVVSKADKKSSQRDDKKKSKEKDKAKSSDRKKK